MVSFPSHVPAPPCRSFPQLSDPPLPMPELAAYQNEARRRLSFRSTRATSAEKSCSTCTHARTHQGACCRQVGACMHARASGGKMTRTTVIWLLLIGPAICLGEAMHARMDCCMHGRTAGKWHLVEHQATGFVDHEER